MFENHFKLEPSRAQHPTHRISTKNWVPPNFMFMVLNIVIPIQVAIKLVSLFSDAPKYTMTYQCLSRKSKPLEIYERTPRDAKLMLQDVGHINSPENQHLTISHDILRLRGLQKLFFRKLEELRTHHFRKFEVFEGQKINPPWLLGGVKPPKILKETQTGMMGPHMFFDRID